MRMTRIDDELELHAFAKKAAALFAKDEKYSSYTDGTIEPGVLFALRWGLGNDCVLVLRLDDCFEPVNFQNLVKT